MFQKLYKVVDVGESASYDLGDATRDTKNETKLSMQKETKTRSKFVASIFCSRRPGKTESKVV